MSNTGWVIKKGELQYKVRFKLDGDQLTAHNDVVVGALQVAPAGGTDDVKRRLGLPLGLIVALVKDQPSGRRSRTCWSTSPPRPSRPSATGSPRSRRSRSLGSIPSRSPRAARWCPRPWRSIWCAWPTSCAGRPSWTSKPSRADAEALKGEAVTARIREFQKERGLDDGAAALAKYYEENLPDVPLPPTVEEQLAVLREREPAPDALVTKLSTRRLEATRERLLAVEGIPAARLIVDEAAPPTPAEAAEEGCVEFGIAARG